MCGRNGERLGIWESVVSVCGCTTAVSIYVSAGKFHI